MNQVKDGLPKYRPSENESWKNEEFQTSKQSFRGGYRGRAPYVQKQFNEGHQTISGKFEENSRKKDITKKFIAPPI